MKQPEDFPFLDLKSLKISPALSQETTAFTAKLVDRVTGKVVGDARNHGTGGCTDLHWIDQEFHKRFVAAVAQLPPMEYKCQGGGTMFLPLCPDSYVSFLVDCYDLRKKLAKMCKTRILVWRPGLKRGVYDAYQLKGDYWQDRQRMQKLAEQHKDGFVVNLRLEEPIDIYEEL